MPNSDPELDHLLVARQHVELAAPKRHPLTRLKKLRVRDLTDAPFVWFPRRANPTFYDQMMRECYRGGLKFPHVVQGGGERADYPKSCIDRHGSGMGACNCTLAVP